MMTNLKDGQVFDDEDGSRVIFNQYSFCEWLKRIMVKYAGWTYENASDKVNNSPLFTSKAEDADDVFFLSHEIDYHWAMLLAHGDMYWLRGIPSDFNDFEDEYWEWEEEIKQKYGLKDSYEWTE